MTSDLDQLPPKEVRLELAVQKGGRTTERGRVAGYDGAACSKEQCTVESQQADRVHQDGDPREIACFLVLVSVTLDAHVCFEKLAVSEVVAREGVYRAHALTQ